MELALCVMRNRDTLSRRERNRGITCPTPEVHDNCLNVTQNDRRLAKCDHYGTAASQPSYPTTYVTQRSRIRRNKIARL